MPIRAVRPIAAAAAAALTFLIPAAPASAELVISQLVVELDSRSRTADVEVLNASSEQSFVAIEPREILSPGTEVEKPVVTPDPGALGLLVSPKRMILEPNQRRTVRIAALGEVPSRERVYRVTIKPVAGDISGSESGLKLLVGYDLLVIARPNVSEVNITVSRAGGDILFTNSGNSSVELIDGKHCDSGGANCRTLPSKRLYAGATWRQPVQRNRRGQYRVRSAKGWSELEF